MTENQITGLAVGTQLKDTTIDVNNQSNNELLQFDLDDLAAPESEQTSNAFGLFELQTANEALQQALQMPDPVYLFDYLIQEGEITILFADTGIGKTVFAVQAAREIAGKGRKVLYLDLELSKKQFQKRFTDENGQIMQLPDTLFRVGYSRLEEAPEGDYTAFFLQSLEALIERTGAKIVFIDNMTKLSAGSTDNARDTLPVLNGLNAIHRKYGLTTVILEHNKKVDTSRPIQLNDLQGSKMKANLCDSIFTIGRSSKDKNLRYIKQVKVRDGELRYDTENVPLYEMVKDSCLHFSFVGYDTEYNHVREVSEGDKANRHATILALKSEGNSNRDIATQLGISEGTVRYSLKKGA